MTDQQQWHRQGQEQVDMSPGLFTYQVHLIRGDATNSSAAQRSKVHTCSARFTYCCQLDSGELGMDDRLAYLPFSERVRDCQADLQYISSSCTGVELFGIYNRQLESIGVPPFAARDPNEAISVRVFLQVTDDGGDQRGCDTVIQKELQADTKTLFYRFKCLLHQVHLVVSKQLKGLPGTFAKLRHYVVCFFFETYIYIYSYIHICS